MCLSIWLPKCLHWPFCPGVFIAILAFVAAAVTFRKDPSQREKAIWIFVFLGLMCAEIWMMGIDRKANEDQQAKASTAQLKGFQDVGSGIKDQLALSEQQFEATMSGLDASIKTSTGGNSFCFVKFVFRGSSAGLILLHHGMFPLADVTVRLFDSDTFSTNTQIAPIQIGTVPIRGSRELTKIVLPNTSEKKYVASFTARNGAWDQFILLRKDSEGWHFATRVQENIGQVRFSRLARPRRVIYEKPDKGFPGTPSQTVWKSFNGIQTFCLDCK